MMRKINFLLAFLQITAVFAASKHPLRDAIKKELNSPFEEDDEEDSIWDSYPEASRNVAIQILDKISGKVFCKTLKLGDTIKFGTIELFLEKAFKNSPDDPRESYALIRITEENKVIFYDWLFASSPSINLFAHPIYDIRVNFSESNES